MTGTGEARQSEIREDKQHRWEVVDLLALERGETELLAWIATDGTSFEVTLPDQSTLRSYFPSIDAALRFLQGPRHPAPDGAPHHQLVFRPPVQGPAL